MKAIFVSKAAYIDGYRVEVVFNDSKKRIVDFGNFLNTHSHPQYNKYKKPDNFKKFRIVNGNIVWGKDWDMIFPIYDLYQGKIEG